MTNWGAHHVDIAQWIIDQCGPGQGPTSIKLVKVETKVLFDENGNPTLDDRYNAPHRFTVHAKFPNGMLMEITSIYTAATRARSGGGVMTGSAPVAMPKGELTNSIAGT